MATCSRCGADLPAGARFCPSCGAAADTVPTALERRVVTILFVDLVGFTERSDRADPEDVRRTLVPFHRRVRDDIERFGGTLDKFIGDAALGVFGAPIAHEDDPVRAVRAGLRILDSVEDLRREDPKLQVRVAVETGEAVVSFGTGPQAGEAVAGDVVNTASRMQSLAPHGALVIGETALGAVRGRFDVEALPPATVKGKREPLRVWRIVGERSTPEPERASFVGRERELASLTAAFEDVAREGRARIVGVLGEAGLGKSRLVAEVVARLGDRAHRLTGVCPPYGEGGTLASVDETVRAIAGIRPSDDAEAATRHVAALAERAESELGERLWLLSTLGVVVGLDVDRGERQIQPEEIAEAWAKVLRLVAAQPMLFVVEDLHWASATLVDVLGTTIDRIADLPVLVVVTARPDARDRIDGWGTEGLPVSTLSLARLDEAETRELLDEILPDGASETSTAVAERAEGNPLYAIEFARMLDESEPPDAATLATPVSVQAVISARLDAIPHDLRALVLDASVLGEQVWPDALGRLSGRPVEEVGDGMDELERRGLLERRASSRPGLDAFGFAHALIREVAYGRLPRGARAERHLAAGTWLEEASGTRADEWAESLARHFATAAELAVAAEEVDVLDRAREPAVRWLTAAADRAARMDPATAFELAERALALAPEGTRSCEPALRRSAHAGRRSGRLDAAEVLSRYRQGLELAREAGDDIAIGGWLTSVGTQLGAMGESARAREALAEAVDVLERHPPGAALARAYGYRAEEELFEGDTTAAMTFANRALELLEDANDEVAIMALHLRGDARCSSGDLAGGIADLEDALRRSEAVGLVGDIVSSRNYLAEWRWAIEGPRAGLVEWDLALELAERRNIRSQGMYTKGGALDALLDAGEWDRALEWSAELLALPPGQLDVSVSVSAHVARTHILLARGRRSGLLGTAELIELAERPQELHAIAPALVAAAAIELADGRTEAAVGWLERFDAVTTGVAPEYRAIGLARAVRLCLRAGRADLAERLIAPADPRVVRDRLRLEAAKAMLAETRREAGVAEAYAELAARLRDYGDPFEEAMALLGNARLTGAERPRARARALLDALGVAPIDDTP